MKAIEARDENNSHVTAETQYVEASRIRFAYRTFGKTTEVPVLFLQHFTGTMDNWDPVVTDGIAESHRAILFNNTGVSTSSGRTPDTVSEMANDALKFIDALGLRKLDLLGFSLGGFIAQEIAAERPELVRKVVLAGTGPKGGEGLDGLPATFNVAVKKEPIERMLYMFFTGSEMSRNEGLAFLKRLQARTAGRDTDSSMETAEAQLKAFVGWGAVKDPAYSMLKKISQPALIVNGGNDIIVPTVNSYTLYQHLPNARLSLYPESAHGALFQYPDLFVREVNEFLSE